jgi:hypothetical protein
MEEDEIIINEADDNRDNQDDSDDGQPTEAQEWNDYDSEC